MRQTIGGVCNDRRGRHTVVGRDGLSRGRGTRERTWRCHRGRGRAAGSETGQRRLHTPPAEVALERKWPE